jgi:hypothetical protein
MEDLHLTLSKATVELAAMRQLHHAETAEARDAGRRGKRRVGGGKRSGGPTGGHRKGRRDGLRPRAR